jgi:hypothetical protein
MVLESSMDLLWDNLRLMFSLIITSSLENCYEELHKFSIDIWDRFPLI